MTFAGFDFYAPMQNPARSGLYDAASLLLDVPDNDDDARIAGGVTIWPQNCGPTGTWPTDPCFVATSETQVVTLTGATTGTFTLDFNGEVTDPIAFDATAAEVEAALELLPSLHDVTVTGAAGGPWTVVFNDPIGDVPELVVDATGTDGTGDVDTTVEGTGVAKAGERPVNSDVFPPLTVWGWDECGDMGAPEHEARARQLLRLKEAFHVESSFAAFLLADAGVPAVGVSLVDSIALLEADIAVSGVRGVIHASTYWTAVAFVAQLIEFRNGRLFTKLGTPWADGAGYVAGLGSTLVASGQVFIWRGDVSVAVTRDWTHNRKMAVAERTILAAYEPCLISAVTVPPLTAGGGGGGGGGILYPAP